VAIPVPPKSSWLEGRGGKKREQRMQEQNHKALWGIGHVIKKEKKKEEKKRRQHTATTSNCTIIKEEL